MPHQCTNCGRSFPDGSKEMLAGCPDCGGNKFQFLPSGAEPADPGGSDELPSSPPASSSSSSPASSPSSREGSDEGSSDSDDIIEAPPVPELEDRAQASARRALVSDDELPRADAIVDAESADDDGPPDLETLREELNDQFESIKILQPGQYELNLMELYDREERVIALEEDGRYVIDVPRSWRDE